MLRHLRKNKFSPLKPNALPKYNVSAVHKGRKRKVTQDTALNVLDFRSNTAIFVQDKRLR